MFSKSKKISPKVQRGIALLDEHGPPDWRERINLDRLNIATINNCVLGQVYGSFGSGAVELQLRFPEYYGFNATVPIGFRKLNHDWKLALSA